jgi:nucleoside diphosphate kinase
LSNDASSADFACSALKPDAVQRGLIGEIIARFEKKGNLHLLMDATA